MNALLSPTLPNQVIIPSSKEQAVNTVLFRTRDSATYRLNCFGLPQWLDFKNADLNLMQQKNVIVSTPYFVDYQDPATKHFLEIYRERFATEPTESAIKGFDQGLLYIGALVEYGRNFMKDLEGKPVKTLHTTYDFTNLKDGGAYQNNYLNMLMLQDDVLIKVN